MDAPKDEDRQQTVKDLHERVLGDVEAAYTDKEPIRTVRLIENAAHVAYELHTFSLNPQSCPTSSGTVRQQLESEALCGSPAARYYRTAELFLTLDALMIVIADRRSEYREQFREAALAEPIAEEWTQFGGSGLIENIGHYTEAVFLRLIAAMMPSGDNLSEQEESDVKRLDEHRYQHALIQELLPLDLVLRRLAATPLDDLFSALGPMPSSEAVAGLQERFARIRKRMMGSVLMTDGQRRMWETLKGQAFLGKELASKLDTSYETVRQWVRELRAMGYAIENRPGRGYYRPDAPPEK